MNDSLDADACYRALVAKDARFDGLFFVGVTTTGIYCRPVCRARTPGRGRCAFFPSAVIAEREGFRACFRCRPELAPGAAPMDAPSRVVATAVARIEEGALNEAGLEDLARELGVTSRHLRRAMHDELGVSPVELAQSKRLALAKRLLHDTRMPVTEVALAAGFGSLRRFNAAFRARFGRPPTELRRLAGDVGDGADALAITLAYREPFAWDALLAFLRPRATPGVEVVEGGVYARTARIGKHAGWVRVSQVPGRAAPGALRAEVSLSLAPALMPLVARLRQLFDLDARPETVASHLRRDPLLRRLVTKRPGLRVPGAFEGFEVAVRAVLGQQVSVAAATTFAGRLAATFGEPVAADDPSLRVLFPTASRLARASVADLASIGLTRARAASLGALARAVDAGELRLDARGDPGIATEALLKLPGIGPWTASYVGMRALGAPDSFPEGDLALRRALGLLLTTAHAGCPLRGQSVGSLGQSPGRAVDVTAREAVARAEAWRPWRAYAALHLWTSLSGDES